MKIALYQPDIAQNVGTTFRTAACLGLDVDIIMPCGFPFDDRKFMRAGMDYIDKVNYTKYSSWEKYADYIKETGSRIITLSSKATQDYTDFKFEKGDILLAGRETAGLPVHVSDFCPHHLTIPMQNGMRSLNVAISIAIVSSEAIRQLRI